jgi:hypothetical protein
VLREPAARVVIRVDAERRLALAHLLDAARRQRLLPRAGDQRGGGTRTPPQSFITVVETASTPLASRADTRVLPHCLVRVDAKRAVKPPDTVLVAVVLYRCFAFATVTVTFELAWKPLPRTTSGDWSAIQTFATGFADALVAVAAMTPAAKRTSMRRTVMFVRNTRSARVRNKCSALA